MKGVTTILITGNKRRDRGFTLIELMVTLSLMSLLFTLSWPALNRAYASYQFDSTVDQMVRCMGAARVQSVMSQKRYKIALENKRSEYRLFMEERDTVPVRFVPVTRGRWRHRFSIPDGIKLLSERTEFLFFPNGTSSKGELSFRDKKGNKRTIYLVPVLGVAREKDNA